MNYAAAITFLKSRNNLPTALGSAELSALDSSVRVSSFFSAKVAEARILDRLREVSDRYSRGELDRTTARAALKTFLLGQGYRPDDVAANPPDGVKRKDWDRNNAITNLASTGRLNLIVDQNFRMAAAVGQYQVSMDPDIAERWPNYRYITGPNPRDSHAALDGFVAKKTDPIWSRIFPPWAFRCNCSVEDCDDEEAADYGGVKKSVNGKIDNNGFIDLSGPSPDGFSFNPAEAFKLPGMDNVPEAYQSAVRDSMISFAENEKIPAEMLESVRRTAKEKESTFFSRKELEAMTEDQLRVAAKNTAMEYYPKFMGKWNPGAFDTPEKTSAFIDSLLSQKLSRTSLIKDTYSMQKRLTAK